FRKNNLLPDTQRIVSAAVKTTGTDAAKVADTGQRHADQPVQEFKHPVAAQGNPNADRHTFPELEVGNRFLRLRGNRALTRDARHLLDGDINQFLVRYRDAHTLVDADLFDLGYLHDRFVTELLLKRRDNFLEVFIL